MEYSSFLILVLGVSGVEQLDGVSLFSQGDEQNYQADIIQNVAITIHDRATSQPIENVSIQIIFDGPPVTKMTDRNGYVSIDIPSRDSVQMVMTHKGYITAREIINLATDPNTNRIVYLDSIAQ